MSRVYILIDKSSFENYKNYERMLKNTLSTTSDYICIILSIPYSDAAHIDSLSKQEKIHFINSQEYPYTLLVCRDNMCEIWSLNIDENISNFILYLYKNINHDIYFWTSVNMKNTLHLQSLINEGFHSPYMCNKSPLGHELKKGEICMYKQNNNNNIHEGIFIQDTQNNAQYIIEQFNIRNMCWMTARFTPNTAKELKTMPINNKKEVAGALTICSTTKVIDRLIHNICLTDDEIVMGNDEDVIVENKRYNFHTHPKDAYVRNGFRYGWPSSHDYIGFLKAVIEVGCIFHVVVTLEGVYIISVAKEYVNQLKYMKDNEEYIEKIYNIRHPSFSNPKEYIHYVNNNLKFFLVTYLAWNDIAKDFIVYFPKTNNEYGRNCIIK
jgi:hypothetical protein